MLTYGFVNLDDGRETTVSGPQVPLVEEGLGVFGGLIEQVREGQASPVRACRLRVRIADVEAPKFFHWLAERFSGFLSQT